MLVKRNGTGNGAKAIQLSHPGGGNAALGTKLKFEVFRATHVYTTITFACISVKTAPHFKQKQNKRRRYIQNEDNGTLFEGRRRKGVEVKKKSGRI